MGIRKESNGKWVAFVSKRHPITKQPRQLRRKNLKSRAEAQRIEKELYAQLINKFNAETVPSWGKTVAEFLQDCRERGLQEYTIENYSLGLKAYTECWWDRPVNRIFNSEIKQQVLTKAAKKSESQKQNIFKFIRGVFTYAAQAGYVNHNPTPKYSKSRKVKIRQFLTENQVSEFLQKAKELDWEWYPIWLLAVYTGMRNGELFALKWQQVDFENSRILVNSSWNNKGGFKDTKSGHDRWVSIPNHILAYLKGQKLKRDDSLFVLPRVHGWEKGDQARKLREFLALCGLPQIRFHDLRATWATILLSKGVAPAYVMTMGGWSEMKTMMIYMRKAGLDVDGKCDVLDFHNPSERSGEVLRLPKNM